MAHILIVDDEASMREFLEIMLSREGHRVETVRDGRSAIERIDGADGVYDLVITDLKLPRESGLDVLEAVKKRSPDIQVIMITAYSTVETAISAMRAGAYDYIAKPFKIEELSAVVVKALEKRALLKENVALKDELGRRHQFEDLISASPGMLEIFELLRKIADSQTSILITGESGTGKELVARAIHHKSSRRERAFVPINCSAIPENLIESELFGHVKGSFTGARADKKGLFEAAHFGTLFLDEVGDLPLSLQPKFMRALQEGEVRRVGATASTRVDVRIIAATNHDIRSDVETGRFREDLYYRLNVFGVHMPPLRERMEDIPLLADHFVAKFNRRLGHRVEGLSEEALRYLCEYSWPGNVRELENIIERAMTLTGEGAIGVDHLPAEFLSDRRKASAECPPLPACGLPLEDHLARIEYDLLRRALEHTGGRKKDAARLLKLTFRSFRYRLKKHGIADDT